MSEVEMKVREFELLLMLHAAICGLCFHSPKPTDIPPFLHEGNSVEQISKVHAYAANHNMWIRISMSNRNN